MRLATFGTLAFGLFTPPLVAQTWSPFARPGDLIDLDFAATSPDHALVVGSTFARETFDGGQSWTEVPQPDLPNGLSPVRYTLDAQGNLYLLGIRNDATIAGPLALIRTSSGWAPFGPDYSQGWSFPPISAERVTRGILDPGLVALEVRKNGGWNGLLSLSTDGGATWASEAPFHGSTGQLEIVETADGPHIVRSRFAHNGTAFDATIERSIGWGVPDVVLQSATPGRCRLGYDPRHPDAMWAVKDPDAAKDPDALLRSLDGGKTWTSLGSTDIYAQIFPNPKRPQTLVRRIASAYSLSTDGGETWADLESPGPTYGPCTWGPEGRYLYVWSTQSDLDPPVRAEIVPEIGVQECAAQVNSTGGTASIQALGSTSVAANDLALVVDGIPADRYGLFLASREAGFVANAGGSFGDLCLGGAIGRYEQWLQESTAYGTLSANLDLASIPQPMGAVAAQTGETWHFQAWFRDAVGGVQVSNYSDAVAVTLEP